MKKNWFVGIDISKKTLDVVIYDSNKKRPDETNYMKVANSQDGYKELLGWFKSKRMRSSAIVVGMEHTGAYGFELRLFLEDRGIDYCAYMPLSLKYSMGLFRGKNDKVDAYRIAEYTYDHRDRLTFARLAGSCVQKLRSLSTERKRLVRQRAECETVITEMTGKEKDHTYIRTLRIKEALDCCIAEIEKEMAEVAKTDEAVLRNYKLLTSIKGIGSVNALSTIIFTDNFKGFETARQYACYLGIAPFPHTSGTSVRGRTRVSPIGAKRLKADITQAAQSSIIWDAEMKAYFERKMKEGKAYGVVLNAVKFKLVCRMFAVVKRGTPFVDLMTYKKETKKAVILS